ncbi:hypothetical protein C0991_010067 [Blastosporella zonata]|nr:hypothetical protein C0991_010067 [Blastosporella zonata]
MGLGFRDKDKGKEKEKKEKERGQSPITPSTPSPSPVPLPPAVQRPTTSQGLFSSLHKGIKKKRSLSSLLETVNSPAPSAPQAARSRSSDAASTLAAIPLVSKGKQKSPEAQRLDEYRQMGLNPTPLPPKPIRMEQKTVWAERHRMKIHTDCGACYMQAYNHILLENDRQADLLLRRLNPLESPSFHEYTGMEPNQVLDLGCGPGHWMLEAANHWKRARITAVDIVDILLPEGRDHSQIDFVQGNFLVFPWPFQKNQFQLVRMANLSLCIPYDKWESVLAEVHRVLSVNGRLELIDDEILFPYAPPPASRPASISGPITKLPPAPTLTKGPSFFDEGAEDEDDVASVNTESTLVSDGDTSSPLHRRRQSSTSTSTSHSHNADALLRVPVSPGAPDLPPTPNSAVTIKPADTDTGSYLPDWSEEASTCKDVETVYRNMLHTKFGVHSQPSKFVPDVIQHVFGNMGEIKSYHLRLAPKDADKEFGTSASDLVGMGVLDEKDGKPISDSKKGRKWFGSDLDKEEKRRKKVSKPSIPIGLSTMPKSPGPNSPSPERLSAKAVGRLGIATEIPHDVSRIPENVSAKAATRLGIPILNERPEIPSRLPTLLPDDSLSDESITPSPSPSPSPSPPESESSSSSVAPFPSPSPNDNRASLDSMSSSSGDSKLSAKAAHRLGISYSALGEATASAKASTRRPLSSSSTLVSSPSLPVQSPGLIVWPNHFIPMSPLELEMHALKNMHTVIGCKFALAEFVGSFRDADGNRIASQEEFEDALWMYECFRRRRFNWPADVPSVWNVDPDTDAPDSATPHSKSGPETLARARSSTLRNSMSLDTPVLNLDDSASAAPYKPDELTQVRTIRVFEAIKTGEYTLSTMKTPRSPPPIVLQLTHNVHGPHDDKFYKFLSGLQDEYDALQRSGYAGEGFFSKGQRVGANVSHDLPPHLARAKALEAAEKRRQTSRVLGSSGRLGGRINTKGLSPRELAAQAAERRARDERSCASGALANLEAEKAAKDSIEDHVIDLTLDDSDSEAVVGVDQGTPVAGSSKSLPVQTKRKPTSTSTSSKLSSATPSSAIDDTPERRKVTATTSQFSSEWPCQVCTLLNAPMALQCDVCLTMRPLSHTAGWACLTCGEPNISHDRWMCHNCGVVKTTS